MSEFGKAIRGRYEAAKGAVVSEATGKRIANRQGSYILRQNFENMARGLDRNGRKMPGYSKPYAVIRRKLGLQTSVVDLKKTGALWNSIRVRNVTIKASGGVLDIRFEITATGEDAIKLQAHTTGRYGHSSRVKKRDAVGLATSGTLRTQQERALKRIALEEIGKSLRGAKVEFVQGQV